MNMCRDRKNLKIFKIQKSFQCILKSTKKKLHGTGGFSLLELLLTCAILVLSTQLIVTTLLEVYGQTEERTKESQAQMLCSALSTAVREELELASDIQRSDPAEGENLSFTSHARAASYESCSLIEKNGSIMLKNDSSSPYKPLLVMEKEFQAALSYEWDIEDTSRLKVIVSILDGNTTNGDKKTLVKNTFYVYPVN